MVTKRPSYWRSERVSRMQMTDIPMTTAQKLKTLTVEQRKLIENMAGVDGCKPTDFTPQQISLMVGRAEFIGEL
jgi:hypothetical protein